MNNLLRKTAAATAVALALSVVAPMAAANTTSTIRGNITGPSGNVAVGTKVIITHLDTGAVKTVTVNEAGVFAAQGLRVGGPYRVFIDSDEFLDKTIDNVFLSLGEDYRVNQQLENSNVETISVSGSRLAASNLGSTSPATNFNLTDLENAPSANRDIKDLVRIDPRINIEESNGAEAIICGGSHPRFSSLTVDGVRMNDSFGLNNNGYPTTRMPFSFSSLDQVAVEIAPFDVQYGGFTGCNINAVTKSGTNEVKGSVFYEFSNDSLRGDEMDGEKVDLGSYDKKQYGFDVGLPLVEDKLFLYVAYEKLEDAQIFNYEPLGNQISQENLDRIIKASKEKYDYDPGGIVPSMPVEDEKVLVKVDWNINENHRASVIYNYNDGFRLSQSDEGNNRLSLSNHIYESGAKLNSTVASLYSDWNDDFSTEMRLGTTKLDNRQTSLDAASGFGEIQIDDNGATVYLGPDDSRQSNDLNWENLTFKIAGAYYYGDHKITGGYEFENLEVFNLFMQHTVGEYRFDSIEEFESGVANDVYYNNSAVTNNPDDAAANFEYQSHSVYLQDEFSLEDADVTFVIGARYDWYTSDDSPRHNALFEERYGYRNDATFDGSGVFQPRFGFNWAIDEALELRGGIGLYSGGNPNVWLSNSYSNDGVTNIDTYRRDVDLFNTDISGDGRPVYNAPQDQVDEVTNNSPRLGSEPSVNAVDPNFEIPTEWKYNIGATYITEDDYILQADFLHSRKQDSALITAANWDDEGRTELFDGRAVYDYQVVGQDNGRDVKRHFRKSDLVLTNAKEDGKSTTISFAVKKDYDFGLNMQLGYAYNKSEDVSPMTSAVSFSNFTGFATTDAQNPGLATSNYETPHRFTMNLRYTKEFFEGYRTSFTLFGSRTAGRPMSFSFDALTVGATEFRSRRHLLYVPTLDDANVTYGDDFDQAAFNKWVDDMGLTRGQITARNSHNSSWHTRFDLKIDQQLPAFSKDHKANMYFVVKNLGNLLNDEWGVKETGNFVAQNVVNARINNDGTYTFNNFYPDNAEQSKFKTQSLWEIKMGIKYRF